MCLNDASRFFRRDLSPYCGKLQQSRLELSRANTELTLV